jgi:hypothetical protein
MGPISELDAALAELEQQGLTVRLHSGKDNTWHIAKGGLYGPLLAPTWHSFGCYTSRVI